MLKDSNAAHFFNLFLFRSPKDHRDDTVVKEELFKIIKALAHPNTEFHALDDRKKVLDMWERNGVRTTNCSLLEDNDF